ncbi:MAG: tRNA (adenosine(37)-N6)-dimethylallyltransferase MiaA, partial [Planctomycetes bacterium]|nr:tRNA (adenosine(37)-N6)-dimethylallyltransferase MiaA [Planctomycetota bacterium]
ACREQIRYHMIDVVESHEEFGLGRYIELADRAIEGIGESQSPVIAVGGTGMYIRALLEGIFDGPPTDPQIREKLEDEARYCGTGPLHKRLKEVDPAGGERIHPNDLKRIIRGLEVYELTGEPISTLQTQFYSGRNRHGWELIEIRRDREETQLRIDERVDRMIEKGLVGEIEELMDRGFSRQAAQAVGYAEIIGHLKGKYNLAKAVAKIKYNTRRLAKHQRTWFRGFTEAKRLDVIGGDWISQVADEIMGE